jgi:micrococcal nuclease
MRTMTLCLLLAVACTNGPTVVRVVDGDTVELSDGQSMRLAGIDCPESRPNTKCRRLGATVCESEVVRGQSVVQEVRVILDQATARAEVIGTERYGRALGYVWIGERDLGQWLVATGRCADWSTKYPHPRGQFYRAP